MVNTKQITNTLWQSDYYGGGGIRRIPTLAEKKKYHNVQKESEKVCTWHISDRDYTRPFKAGRRWYDKAEMMYKARDLIHTQ